MPPEPPHGSSSPPNELEERLAHLEQALSLDQLQPSYLTLDPTGHVGADFTGHIHAQGLDLDAGTNTTPPTEDRIRWLRTSDGALVAELFAWATGGQEGLQIHASALAATDNSQSSLGANDDQGTTRAFLNVFQNSRGAAANINAAIGALLLRILGQDGSSDFLQLAATARRALFLAQSVNLVFTASTKATEIAVVHNLGRVPQAILVTPIGDPGVVLAPYAKNSGSTTTANIGAYTTAAISATKTVSVAIIG